MEFASTESFFTGRFPSEVVIRLNFQPMNPRAKAVRQILANTLGLTDLRESPLEFRSYAPKKTDRKKGFGIAVCLRVTTDYSLKKSQLSRTLEEIGVLLEKEVRFALMDSHRNISTKISLTIIHMELMGSRKKYRIKTKTLTTKPLTVVHKQ